MNTAKEINYRTQAAYELAKSIPCPRCTSDVYSLGVSLQYCIRAKYMEIADSSHMAFKTVCADQVVKQMNIKKEIEKVGNQKLNLLIQYFYEHGGPIMEDPVSEQIVKEIKPFFNRLMRNYINSLDEVAEKALRGKIGASELVTTINHDIINMYSAMGNLFMVDEMREAFNDLIDIREYLS
jgi:O-phosphoseryl-tRNA(Cys) synthetase